MTARTVTLDDLVGRAVHDADGRRIGRIEELKAEIELHGDGNDYVVKSFGVGRLGMLDAIATGHIVPRLVERLTRAWGYVHYDIPWDWMDLSDPRKPKVTRRESELPRTSVS